MMIEYLSWCPDRTVFAATMAALVNPVTGGPLATLEGDRLVPSDGVRIDEIGAVIRGIDPETLEPVDIVPGHHANLVAYGALAGLLAAGGGWDGIFPLLGAMAPVEPVGGVPAGWAGSSGMRIYPAEAVSSRVRVWA